MVDEESSSNDSWMLWSKIYSDRDVRMKLLCRDPLETTPTVSNVVVVSDIHQRSCINSLVQLFEKYGPLIKTEVSSDNGYFKCILTFQYVRNAIAARNNLHGFILNGTRLKVEHLDIAEQLSKAEEQNGINLNDSAEENVFGYVRQAQFQCEYRALKSRSKRSLQAVGPSPNNINCSVSGGSSNGSVSGERAEECWDVYDNSVVVNFSHLNLNESPETNLVEENLEEIVEIPTPSLKRVKCIDDVLLESEDCFWEWLYAKLNFSGPMLHNTKELKKALSKLPTHKCRTFEWLLNAVRLSDRFAIISQYICLKSQIYWAREMCFISSLGDEMRNVNEDNSRQ